MAIWQRGLEMRLQRQALRIASQHHQLNSLYAITAQTLETGSAQEARNSFRRFGDALAAHVDLEDEFFFPAIRGLRPDFVPDLEALGEEHGGFRAELERLDQLLERGEREGTKAALRQFVDRLAAHEEREEELLARMRRGGDAGA